ncbi:2-amino-4-hydroxy-6-hydroxymethyldihydropteridine diphosphokinase [Ferrimonas lipolytica]|uniref:2-amino-4-hydroxy-6-hydroxymethyldihydropteridine diphosphokinase n=1 Tax=Ferrimonas lipolytica TaxID=2724191 RepID=A0A6H1UF81_9GAMM|nr:2-amino-4-hydroxy-6-hydroxymethyldihydropteridine diphosphokinase [Ferrimonas lipolytica]QIZ77755.1 2-amino-4-hydroxy-6-hydroxymethyldihydropteridine diphosphokinase [Ferrimonas lipolytica]
MTRIFISLGSNIDAHRHISNGLNDLTATLDNVVISTVYESEAVGFEGDNFLNLVAQADTNLPIAEVVALFKRIEQAHGRILGAKKFAPRTLDLDLLLYGDVCVKEPVELPRAEIFHNAFVLLPLQELWPEGVIPGSSKNLQQLWQQYPQHSQKLWPIAFAWPNSES